MPALEKTKNKPRQKPQEAPREKAQHTGGTLALEPLAHQGAAALVAAVFAGGQVLLGASPLGLALLLAAGERFWASTAAGAVLGYVLALNFAAALPYIAAAAIFVLARLALAGAPRAFEMRSFIAVAAFFLMKSIPAFAGSGIGGIIGVFAEGLVMLGASYILHIYAAALESGRVVLALTREERAALFVSYVCFIAALSTLPLGFAQYAGVAAAAAGGALGAHCGGEKTAIVWAGAGAIGLALGSPEMAFAAVGILSASGAAGILYPSQRGKVAGVFAAAACTGLLIAPSAAMGGKFLFSAWAGAAMLLVLPKKHLTRLARGMGGAQGAGAQFVHQKLKSMAGAMQYVGDTLDELWQATPAARGEDVFNQTANICCKKCPGNTRCWVQNYNDTQDALNHMLRAAKVNGYATIADMPAHMQKNCINPVSLCGTLNNVYARGAARRGESAKNKELQQAVRAQYSALSGALAQLSAEAWSEEKQDPERSQRLLRLAQDLGFDALSAQVSKNLHGRIRAVLTLERTELSLPLAKSLAKEAGYCCKVPFGTPVQVHNGPVVTLVFLEKATYEPEVASLSVPAGSTCGDVTRFFNDDGGKAYLTLCDGMGVGPHAAVDGTFCAVMLQNLLKGGFTPEHAMSLCTVAMMEKQEGDSGAGVDLCALDLYTGRGELYKAGAAHSYIVKKGQVSTCDEDGLPLGLTLRGQSGPVQFALAEGDMVLLMSDGMAHAGRGWLDAELARCQSMPVQELCEHLMALAQSRNPNLQDDLTVAGLRLKRN